MNSKDLDSFRTRYSKIRYDHPSVFNPEPWLEYPDLIDDMLQVIESYVKREQELFNVANHILWVDYRDYTFKVWLDAERNTLVGDVLLNNEIDVTGIESDSLTHLLTELERQVDNQINYRHQSQLAKENIQLQDRVKELEEECLNITSWL